MEEEVECAAVGSKRSRKDVTVSEPEQAADKGEPGSCSETAAEQGL